MLTVEISLPEVEELQKLVQEGLEKGVLTYDEIAAGLDGAARIADGMREHPDLIRGPLATDTRLMRALPGWIAKGGAEGLLCASGYGIGVALKSEDGNGRALGPAAAAFFSRLELDLDELSVLPLENSRKERVGEVRI